MIMKEIYTKLWNLARPYYEKGRPMDINHIEWMIKDALIICKTEHIDDSFLLPLVILHDVGYSEVPKNNPFNINTRKAHMKASEKIAKDILDQVEYPKEKCKKIAYYVSVHDEWALGNNEIYKKDIVLGTFSDLDYMWMTTPKGFPTIMKILNKNRKEMLEYLEHNEKLTKRPFSTKTAKELYKKYFYDRKKEK